MVRDYTCGRTVEATETLYTRPWLPYGYEGDHPTFEDSVGQLYTEVASELTAQRCGLTYSNERGMWLCRECAYKNGYLW